VYQFGGNKLVTWVEGALYGTVSRADNKKPAEAGLVCPMSDYELLYFVFTQSSLS
jgi:hypothetical protein